MKCAFDIMIILNLSYAQLAHIKQELEKEIEIEREVNEALRERGQDLSSQLERADQDFDAQHHRNNRLEKDLAAARGEISQLKIDADHRDSVHQDELKTAKLSYELRFACLEKTMQEQQQQIQQLQKQLQQHLQQQPPQQQPPQQQPPQQQPPQQQPPQQQPQQQQPPQ